MGCDIHSYCEVKKDGVWVPSGDVFPLDEYDRKAYTKTHGVHPFDWRSYGLFGFLADVRNYSHVPCIQPPTYSLLPDVSSYVREAYDSTGMDTHSMSTLTARQLVEYNYSPIFWDRRVMKSGNGAALADEGEGAHLTLREFLGERFFVDLAVLKSLGPPDDVRIVFWFDC
jgi:hypothetical protein